ncbi:FtsX-like permease family protein [candidate division WWE3 bacterium]|uniref:Cell division protein FtsX n=1 Tax=candidate division WWE3 bacterium TaxID=2053526 RepID=A0A928TW76_UNCKA|nr:FtsX-like permease family protein [candidate division WWE3 bacterium]
MADMKYFTNGARVIKAAFQNIIRNAWLGIATVMVLILALTSVNLLIGVNALLSRAVNILEDKIDVTVFFKRDANDALVRQARFFIEGLPQVRAVELIPADQSLEMFRERHANDPEILQALGELEENPLGATLRIQAHDTSNYPFIIETLKNPQFADAIESRTYDDHADSIARVHALSEQVRWAGTALIIVFALIGILIVFNTVRVAIYTQREEIGIMRLVGASSLYVRAPFVLQGLFLAALAMVITGLLVGIGIAWMNPILTPLYDGADPGLASYFTGNWPLLLLIEGGGLALIVIVTSWAAVGKYLKR